MPLEEQFRLNVGITAEIPEGFVNNLPVEMNKVMTYLWLFLIVYLGISLTILKRRYTSVLLNDLDSLNKSKVGST